MQNFENSLVDEFKEKKNNFCNAKQFLESISDFDKIIFVIITYMKSYFDFCKDYSKISLYVHKHLYLNSLYKNQNNLSCN